MTSLDLVTETCVWCIYLKQPPDHMRSQCRDESRMVLRRVGFLNLDILWLESSLQVDWFSGLCFFFSCGNSFLSCEGRMNVCAKLQILFYPVDWLTSIKPSLVATTGFCTSSFKLLCKHMFLFIIAIFVALKSLSVSVWNCPLWYIPIWHIFVQISALSTDTAQFFFICSFWGSCLWDVKNDVEKIYNTLCCSFGELSEICIKMMLRR